MEEAHMWQTQAIRYLQCVLMKRHRPLQSGDRFFFVSQCLFLKPGFHWLSLFVQAADVTQAKGNIHIFIFFAPQLASPDFCPASNRSLVWEGGKSPPYTSTWVESTPAALAVAKPANQRPIRAFSLQLSMQEFGCSSWTSSRHFAVMQKRFYLAVINIPLGFCLKLHPTDKKQKKKSQPLSKVLIFFLVKHNPPMQCTPPTTTTHTRTPKKTSQSNWSWRTNFWFALIQLDNLTNNLDSKSPEKLLSWLFFFPSWEAGRVLTRPHIQVHAIPSHHG